MDILKNFGKLFLLNSFSDFKYTQIEDVNNEDTHTHTHIYRSRRYMENYTSINL